MSEVILPFKIQDVTSYCSNASICAIARNTSDSEEWLANNFIQFHYETEYDVFHYMGTHILQKFCPFIQHEQLDRDLINSIWYGKSTALTVCKKYGHRFRRIKPDKQ